MKYLREGAVRRIEYIESGEELRKREREKH